MSKLNKLVTNYPVSLSEEEIENLSATLAPVVAACGGGGGGTGGKIYTGIGFVTVNNSTNQIGLTEAANTKLNQDIPTKVSDLSDSANYQTVAGMNEYLTTANASTTYQTIEDMSAYYKKTETSSKSELDDEFSKYATVNQLMEEIDGVNQTIYNLQDTVAGKQDKLNFGYDENNAISSIDGNEIAGAGGVTGDYYSASNPSGFINSAQAETQILAKKYITSGVSQLDNFYSKTDTSSRTEIANAIKDFITEDDVLEKHYLTKASGDLYYLPNPSELIEGTQYAYTTQGWSPIQGGGGASGISFVNHDGTLVGDGNTVKLGVDTTVIQTKLTDSQIQNITDVTTLKTASSTWNNVSAKLNTSDFNTYTATTAPATYQPKGDYLSSNALEGYATTALLDTISSKIESDIPTTVAQLTDSGNYYQKTETSSKNELSTEFAKYQPTGDYLVADDITGKLDKSIYANASGNWENTYNVVNQYSAAGTWLTEHQSLINYYTKDETSGASEIANALNTKVDKPTSIQTGKLVYDGDTSAWVTLPAGTTTIVQGQGSVTANYNSQNSTYTVSLLASAENALAGVNDKIDTTAVAQTYQTKSDMANYLTTSDAADTYQPKGNYATTSDISDMATQTWVGQQGFYTKASGDNDYAPISITATVNTLTAASAGWNNKVDKPTSLVDKYLVLRTDTNGDVSGWYDLQAQSYSKSEADRTFVATANIDTTTLSGDGKSVSTKLGVKTDVIATIDYVSGNYLPTSGGTVTGQLVVSGGAFDTLELKRSEKTSTGIIGINGDNGMSFKVVNSNNNTQLNISPNATMDKRFSIGDDVYNPSAYFIPAVTSTTTAGLTNDGILHIILES